MKNPRFEDSALGALARPDITKLMCRTCVWRAADRFDGQIKGATLSVCGVYNIKPDGIIFRYDKCPYFVEGERVSKV